MKKYYLNFFSILLFFNSFIFAKHFIIKSNVITKDYINKKSSFKVIALQDILKNNSQIEYISVCNPLSFEYPEFSIASKFPNKGCFDELFVLSVPNGRVLGKYGHIFIDNKIPQELVWGQRYQFLNHIQQPAQDNIRIINGRVAVIAQYGYNNYFHWINELLGRLATLEMADIEYDWLYVPDEMKYAKETLELWGIGSKKIISPESDNFCIQADELIVPSLVSNSTAGYNFAGTFIHPITMSYVRKKLLQKAYAKENIDIDNSPKKIFISRKDSYAARKILNEDEIFELFKAQGFVRYELSSLSVVEQIILFNNAEVIVSEQGSGLSNILFCKPNTNIIEIFQAMIDNCFWWQASVLGLRYFPYTTIPVNTVIFSQCDFQDKYHQAWMSQINLSAETIKRIVKKV